MHGCKECADRWKRSHLDLHGIPFYIYLKKFILHLTLIQTAVLPPAVFQEQKYFRVYRKIPTPSGLIR